MRTILWSTFRFKHLSQPALFWRDRTQGVVCHLTQGGKGGMGRHFSQARRMDRTGYVGLGRFSWKGFNYDGIRAHIGWLTLGEKYSLILEGRKDCLFLRCRCMDEETYRGSRLVSIVIKCSRLGIPVLVVTTYSSLWTVLLFIPLLAAHRFIQNK